MPKGRVSKVTDTRRSGLGGRGSPDCSPLRRTYRLRYSEATACSEGLCDSPRSRRSRARPVATPFRLASAERASVPRAPSPSPPINRTLQMSSHSRPACSWTRSLMSSTKLMHQSSGERLSVRRPSAKSSARARNDRRERRRLPLTPEEAHSRSSPFGSSHPSVAGGAGATGTAEGGRPSSRASSAASSLPATSSGACASTCRGAVGTVLGGGWRPPAPTCPVSSASKTWQGPAPPPPATLPSSTKSSPTTTHSDRSTATSSATVIAGTQAERARAPLDGRWTAGGAVFMP
mmetsp:Transcript_105445/g.330326  ORF Transcript_105445/g.330326 Transcript_105445/m.330326 type:complete len:291 (-) Transcript_105445:4-876(-)